MKVSAIIVAFALVLTASQTRSEESRKSVIETEQSEDRGTRIRDIREEEASWKALAAEHLFGQTNVERMTDADAEEVLGVLGYALTSTEENVSYEWSSKGIPASGRLHIVRLFNDSHYRACRTIENAINAGDARERRSITVCLKPSGRWTITNSQATRAR